MGSNFNGYEKVISSFFNILKHDFSPEVKDWFEVTEHRVKTCITYMYESVTAALIN